MIRFLLAAACALALSAPAASAQVPYARFDEAPASPAADDAANAAWRSWSARSAAALAATGQPRELAFAALLRGLTSQGSAMPGSDGPSQAGSGDAQAAAWRLDAAARAGEDTLANALLSYDRDAAIRIRAAQRWLGAEPRNLAPLLVRGGSVDALLADARGATRFDLGMLPQVRWMHAALLRTPPSAAERAAFAAAGEFVVTEHAAIQAMSLWGAVALPALQPLMTACDASALAGNPARARDCRHVGAVMADASDTMLGQLIGLALLDRLAETPGERADLQARRRTLDWRNLEWGRASAALPRDGAAQLVRLLADTSIASEPQLVERALGEAGIALEPPAGWRAPEP